MVWTLAEFEGLVEQALASLPPGIEAGLDNVAIIIQDWPSPEQMEDNNLHSRRDLLGLYEGIPLGRSHRLWNGRAGQDHDFPEGN